MAKKLKDCGVFGVSSDEYLNYAQQNRREWELNGEAVVDGMKKAIAASLSRISSSSSIVEPVTEKASSTNSSEDRNAETKNSSDSELAPLPDSYSILIVDDDKISRKLLTQALRKIAPEWNINAAESGEEAIAQVCSSDCNNFDLIFVDEYLGNKPGALLGSHTVTKLREQGFGGLVCGMSATDAHTSFKDAGSDAFVFKPLPFRPVALTKELIRIISISGSA